MNIVYFAENLSVLKQLSDKSVSLIYIDPPFNTGKTQKRNRNQISYNDSFDDYIGFLRERVKEAHRILADNGSLYLHVDYREAHRVRLLLDEVFGEDNFLNEIIWAYDYGARPKNKWPCKHDNIYLYVKDIKNYVFNQDDVEKIPYMAPGLQKDKEKAAKGKCPSDCWWHTIVPTNSKQKTGYPTEKPVGIIKRMIAASSNEGDIVLDFFAGSGTTGEAANQLNRRFILIDSNEDAIKVMKKRFTDIEIGWKEL